MPPKAMTHANAGGSVDGAPSAKMRFSGKGQKAALAAAFRCLNYEGFGEI